jgi:hypothetical protein
MSNEEFKIPEMAYKIPLKEFFVWYDTLLAKQWNAMGAEERNKYFAKADLEELKNTALEKLGEHCFQDVHITDIQKAVTVSNIMDLKDHPLPHTDAHMVYFRIMEFTKLENNMDILHDAMNKFIVEKTVNKLLGEENKK